LKSQSVYQESINTDIDNKVQNTQKATTSTHFDAEIINTLTKDQVPIEVKFFPCPKHMLLIFNFIC